MTNTIVIITGAIIGMVVGVVIGMLVGGLPGAIYGGCSGVILGVGVAGGPSSFMLKHKTSSLNETVEDSVRPLMF